MPAPAPIVLFIYNRPAHTARALAALAANALAPESALIIFADGPKKTEHAEAVREARTIARSAKGFRSVQVIERTENLGLARSIMSGLAQICSDAGRAIVVEDDLLVGPRFLEFLNLALSRYADDERVLQVSGYAFPVSSAQRAHFLPIVSCWGWATWARAWAHFDPEMTGFEQLSADADLRSRFNLDGAYDYWGMARSQRGGSIDSWGIRWQMSLFNRGGLALYPPSSLVENTGVDSSGTHGAGQAGLQRPLSLAVEGGEWHWPTEIQTDLAILAQVQALLKAQQPSFAKTSIDRLARAFLPRQARAALKGVLKRH